MHARAGAQARDLADVYARFFAGLAGEVAPPQPLDAADPAAWFEQLAALAMQASQDRVAALHIDLAAAAERSGQSNASRRSAAAGQVEGAARLARLTTLYVELIDGISEAASAAQAEYLQAVLAAAQGTAPATRGGLQLEGRVGDAAEAWMAIENSTAAPVTIHCSVGPVRRADGINPAFAPDVVVTPAHVLLEAGEDAQVRLQVVLDAGHYEAGAVYVGTLYVHRDGDPCRDVPLRIVPARAIERAGAR